ncbi:MULTISPECIES: LysR family transcriptional regulator [Vibrio]|uniref:LysR family transcriptional regulator n=1 Tax=Vibrio TaxID=662 RepID=UPI0020756E66|nr:MULTISPECIES: LysR family transcriptional regulator [Vibrio]USD31332.1 LysR family transcriptional regulator [Vibrio sp. SCSIO 43186]USD44377.1 LysR family transcriptional regulator [Vibrio sp. SCSIO 43145]USD68455.1 LysR family transcriptional regulator [Vibrio sp. SCSIO 43139]USD96141.1 LysR family transcriptional regulator [Vibrio coralliilyticus]
MDYLALSRISLKHLTVLQVLLSTHSVSSTAQILCVTPSSVSKTLTQLRTQLKDELFYREKTSLVPTPFALSIATDVHKILACMNGILHQGEFEPKNFIGTIALSMRESTFELFSGRITEINAQLTSANIQIFAKEQLSFDALLRGQVDFMILPHDISQPPTRSRDLVWEQIQDDEMVCLMSPQHPLANQSLNTEEYLAYQHIGILDKDLSTPYFEQNLTQQYSSRNIAISVADFGSAAVICHQTEFLLTCSKMWAEKSLQAQSLIQKPLPFSYGKVAYSLVWNQASSNDPALKWLHSQLIKPI